MIPGSMGTRSYIVLGKAHPMSFCSAPHGAGRRYSRTKARALFTMDDLGARWKASSTASPRAARRDSRRLQGHRRGDGACQGTGRGALRAEAVRQHQRRLGHRTSAIDNRPSASAIGHRLSHVRGDRCRTVRECEAIARDNLANLHVDARLEHRPGGAERVELASSPHGSTLAGRSSRNCASNVRPVNPSGICFGSVQVTTPQSPDAIIVRASAGVSPAVPHSGNSGVMPVPASCRMR